MLFLISIPPAPLVIKTHSFIVVVVVACLSCFDSMTEVSKKGSTKALESTCIRMVTSTKGSFKMASLKALDDTW